MAAEGSCTQPAMLSFTLFARGVEGGELACPILSPSASDVEQIITGQQSITAISEQTRGFFFRSTRRILAQMSLDVLVIVATAAEAHGPSFENCLPRYTKTAHVESKTYTA